MQKGNIEQIMNDGEVPIGATVAILCEKNECFVRFAEDGRTLADTPTASEHQRDVHFEVKKKDGLTRFVSVLWSKPLWKDYVSINSSVLSIKTKKGVRYLGLEDNSSVVSFHLDKPRDKFLFYKVTKQVDR